MTRAHLRLAAPLTAAKRRTQEDIKRIKQALFQMEYAIVHDELGDEEIRRYAQISSIRQDVVSLIAATTGLQIALKATNPRATDELKDALKQATSHKK